MPHTEPDPEREFIAYLTTRRQCADILKRNLPIEEIKDACALLDNTYCLTNTEPVCSSISSICISYSQNPHTLSTDRARQLIILLLENFIRTRGAGTKKSSSTLAHLLCTIRPQYHTVLYQIAIDFRFVSPSHIRQIQSDYQNTQGQIVIH